MGHLTLIVCLAALVLLEPTLAYDEHGICRGRETITDDFGTFASTIGTTYHALANGCEWILAPSGGGPVTLVIDIDWEFYGVFEVYDGFNTSNPLGSPLLYNLAVNFDWTTEGELPPPSITALSGVMRVVFHSGAAYHNHGFHAWYWGPSASPTCGGAFSSTAWGLLHDWISDGLAPFASTCTWTVQSDTLRDLTLYFESGHSGLTSGESVTVKHTNGTILAIFDESTPYWDNSRTLQTNTNQVIIEYDNISSGFNYGLTFAYYPTPDVCSGNEANFIFGDNDTDSCTWIYPKFGFGAMPGSTLCNWEVEVAYDKPLLLFFDRYDVGDTENDYDLITISREGEDPIKIFPAAIKFFNVFNLPPLIVLDPLPGNAPYTLNLKYQSNYQEASGWSLLVTTLDLLDDCLPLELYVTESATATVESFVPNASYSIDPRGNIVSVDIANGTYTGYDRLYLFETEEDDGLTHYLQQTWNNLLPGQTSGAIEVYQTQSAMSRVLNEYTMDPNANSQFALVRWRDFQLPDNGYPTTATYRVYTALNGNQPWTRRAIAAFPGNNYFTTMTTFEGEDLTYSLNMGDVFTTYPNFPINQDYSFEWDVFGSSREEPRSMAACSQDSLMLSWKQFVQLQEPETWVVLVTNANNNWTDYSFDASNNTVGLLVDATQAKTWGTIFSVSPNCQWVVGVVHHQLLAVVRPGLFGTPSQFKWRQFLHIPPSLQISSTVMTDALAFFVGCDTSPLARGIVLLQLFTANTNVDSRWTEVPPIVNTEAECSHDHGDFLTAALHPSGEYLLVGRPVSNTVYLYHVPADSWMCVSFFFDNDENFLDQSFGQKVEFVPHPFNASLDEVLVVGAQVYIFPLSYFSQNVSAQTLPGLPCIELSPLDYTIFPNRLAYPTENWAEADDEIIATSDGDSMPLFVPHIDVAVTPDTLFFQLPPSNAPPGKPGKDNPKVRVVLRTFPGEQILYATDARYDLNGTAGLPLRAPEPRSGRERTPAAATQARLPRGAGVAPPRSPPRGPAHPSLRELPPFPHPPRSTAAALRGIPFGGGPNGTELSIISLQCPLGTYNPGSFFRYCVFCPAGTFQNSTGATECVPCQAEEYCPLGASIPLDDIDDGTFYTVPDWPRQEGVPLSQAVWAGLFAPPYPTAVLFWIFFICFCCCLCVACIPCQRQWKWPYRGLWYSKQPAEWPMRQFDFDKSHVSERKDGTRLEKGSRLGGCFYMLILLIVFLGWIFAIAFVTSYEQYSVGTVVATGAFAGQGQTSEQVARSLAGGSDDDKFNTFRFSELQPEFAVSDSEDAKNALDLINTKGFTLSVNLTGYALDRCSEMCDGYELATSAGFAFVPPVESSGCSDSSGRPCDNALLLNLTCESLGAICSVSWTLPDPVVLSSTAEFRFNLQDMHMQWMSLGTNTLRSKENEAGTPVRVYGSIMRDVVTVPHEIPDQYNLLLFGVTREYALTSVIYGAEVDSIFSTAQDWSAQLIVEPLSGETQGETLSRATSFWVGDSANSVTMVFRRQTYFIWNSEGKVENIGTMFLTLLILTVTLKSCTSDLLSFLTFGLTKAGDMSRFVYKKVQGTNQYQQLSSRASQMYLQSMVGNLSEDLDFDSEDGDEMAVFDMPKKMPRVPADMLALVTAMVDHRLMAAGVQLPEKPRKLPESEVESGEEGSEEADGEGSASLAEGKSDKSENNDASSSNSSTESSGQEDEGDTSSSGGASSSSEASSSSGGDYSTEPESS